MFTKTLPFVLICFFTSTVFADISVDVKQAETLTGLINPKIVKDFVFFDDKSEPKFVSVALLKVTTEAKFVKVKARKTLFENADITKLSETEFLLIGSGKYAVEVTTFDPEKGIDEKVVAVELLPTPTPPGPTPPKPPGPTPIVPDDRFDNLGKRVAEWSRDLPKKSELATLYLQASKEINENSASTISEVGMNLNNRKNELLGPDLPKYQIFYDNLTNDLKARWPIGRKDYADYLFVVYKGLGGP